MATLPLPGSSPTPSTTPTPSTRPLDPDEVGYVSRRPMPEKPTHTPLTCEDEHCSCHLGTVFTPPGLELSGREALVLAWHLFPLKEDEELSFEEIGRKLGVTATRVKQIYQRAGAKIRAYPRSHYPERPGTPEYEKQLAAAEAYRQAHPEYADRRALLDAHEVYENGADPQ